MESHLRESNACQPPPWLKRGAVVSYRGGTEKVISVTPTTIETVGYDRFCSWHPAGLYLAIGNGEVTHRPDGRRVRPDSPPRRAIMTGPDAAACAAFNRLCRSFASDQDPRKLISAWMRAVSQNTVVEPWQNLLGLFLIRLGAEHLRLGVGVAKPSGRGRPSFRRQEAAATQELIGRFDLFLKDGDPISSMDWGWLRYLVEVGMSRVGLIPSLPLRKRGRPPGHGTLARSVLAQVRDDKDPRTRGSRATAIRQAAVEVVLQRRMVAAAWRGENHALISVADDDPDVKTEFRRIESDLNSILRRSV